MTGGGGVRNFVLVADSLFSLPRLTSDSTLRFRTEEAVLDSLAAAGFTADEIRDAPDRPGREFVFIASRGA
jgi:hypothetical protein